MEYRRTGNTIIARLDRGEELLTKLCELAEAENILFAWVDGYGYSRDLCLCYSDTGEDTCYGSDYTDVDFVLTSVKGVLARDRDGSPAADIYATVANPSYGRQHVLFEYIFGFAVGGAVNSARVSTQCVLRLDILDVDASLEPGPYDGSARLVFGSS